MLMQRPGRAYKKSILRAKYLEKFCKKKPNKKIPSKLDKNKNFLEPCKIVMFSLTLYRETAKSYTESFDILPKTH
jgi:hypothetical protein